MPFDDNGELKLEGAKPLSMDHATVENVARRLQQHYDMRSTGMVALTAWESAAVLNVLIGKAPPVDTENDRQ